MQPVMDALRLDGALVNVGAPYRLEGLDGMARAFGRKSLAGSVIGGIAETQAVIDHCAARNSKADIELIQPDQINAALDRVKKDVRYRFVIDTASLKAAMRGKRARSSMTRAACSKRMTEDSDSPGRAMAQKRSAFVPDVEQTK